MDTKTIVEGSIDRAFERHHYYQSMQIHKECFRTLVQFCIEKVIGQSRSYSVFLKIFRTQQRITKGFKTIVNSIFCLNLFSFPSFEVN